MLTLKWILAALIIATAVEGTLVSALTVSATIPSYGVIDCMHAAEQFKIVNVTLTVKDYDGTVMRDAEVYAFSEDWGIRSPDWFGLTEADGTYVFEIPVGNWSFFAGGGWRYVSDNPGEGYFATRRFVQIADDYELIIQPDDTITIAVYDINSQPLDTEIRMMDNDHVPIVITPTCGKTNNGEITIHVTQGLNYDILFYTPHDIQPGYIIHEKTIPSGSSLEVRPTFSAVTHLTFQAYDTGNNPTNGLTVNVNYHGFSVGTTTGLNPISFPVNGTADIYATPELIRIVYIFEKNGWHYSFVGNDYNLTAGIQFVLQFGGPFTVDINVLRQNTQIWLDVRDSFGKIMGSFSNQSGEAPVPIKLTRNGTIIFEEDISENVGSWNALMAGKLDVTYDVADSPDFEILLDLGFFGFFNLTGTLLADANRLHYETIETEHFTINAPEGFSDRFSVMATLFESAYDAESRVLNVELTNKTEITFYINPGPAGFAATNIICMGIGFSLDSSYNIVPSTFIGVAFHELGHVFQLSPPLNNFFITGWFGEPFATLLGYEAISQTLGWKFGLHQQGGHNRFFEYLKGKQPLDLVENIQFVLFYLRRTYGMEIHRNFVQLWANSTMNALKSKLQNAGFNTNETLVTLYSYVAGENLAWLFKIAGVDISKMRIAQGIELIKVQTIDSIVIEDGITFHVIISSNSTIITDSNFNRTEKRIDFKVTGLEGMKGFCNVTIPKVLLRAEPLEAWEVSIDDSPPLSLIITENVTHTFLYFTYSHTTHKVKIIGTIEEGVLIGEGWGWLRIKPRKDVWGRANLYKVEDEQIELVISHRDEEYSRAWNIICHRERKHLETYFCYSHDYGSLIVNFYKRWQFWWCRGRGVLAIGFNKP